MATVVGSLKRRGPALPGLIKRIPCRFSISGLCEWPETTAVNPAASGSKGVDLMTVNFDDVVCGKTARPGAYIVIAAHGSDGRDASEHVQNRWIADVAAMNDEVGVAQRVKRLRPNQTMGI